jgi:Zn-finger nucleic acid-binding protein
MKRRCPKDDTVMNQIQYEGQTLDQCTLCGGIWCDSGEFEAILSARDRKFSTKEIEAAKFLDKIQVVELERRKALKCVACQTPLTKKDLKTRSQVTIDICPKGHGTWLDYGELERIQILMEEAERAHTNPETTQSASHFSELIKQARAVVIPAKPRVKKG